MNINNNNNNNNNIDKLYLTDKEIKQNQQKQEIICAFKQGNLGLREVKPYLETKYLTNKNKDPRPFSLVIQDVPTAMRSTSIAQNPTLGIINPICLAAYKENACTGDLIDNKNTVDQLFVKCLPNRDFLIKKCRKKVQEFGKFINQLPQDI